MKLVDVKSNTHINSSKEINDEDPKFKIRDIVRISKYKNIFAKSYVPNWPEEAFVIVKVKKRYINGEQIVRTFYEKELLETNQKN